MRESVSRKFHFSILCHHPKSLIKGLNSETCGTAKVLSFLSALLQNICILHVYHQTKTVDLIQAAGNIFDWVGTTMAVNRLVIGCQQAGDRLASGWRQFQLGTCMHVGFMAANRLATGCHQAGDNFKLGAYTFLAANRLATGWHQAGDIGNLHACRFHGCHQAGDNFK